MVFLARPWVRGEGGPRAPTPPELRLSPAGCRAPGRGASRCDRGVLNRGGKRLQPVNPGTVLGVFFGLPAAALSAGEEPLPTPAGAPPAPYAPPEVFARSQPEPGGPNRVRAPLFACCGARQPPGELRAAGRLSPLSPACRLLAAAGQPPCRLCQRARRKRTQSPSKALVGIKKLREK